MIFRRVLVSCIILVVLFILESSVGAGKPLRGIGGVELGMSSNTVVRLLQAEGGSEHLLKTAQGLTWRVPNHRVFRHAEFRFDGAGLLTEIVLSVRECLDKKKAVQDIRKSYEVDLTGDATVIRDGLALTMVGNKVFIKDAQTSVVGTGGGQRLSGDQPRRR